MTIKPTQVHKPASAAPGPSGGAAPGLSSSQGGLWLRFKRGCVLFWLLAAWSLSQSASAAPSPLLTPAALLAQLPQVRVIDIREGAASSSPYAAGHIPGAVWAPYSSWRGAADNPGKLRSVADYTALVRSLGLNAPTPVVLVADGSDPSDFGAPARVYWTLKWLGLGHLAILNGGMTAWARAGLPVTRQSVQAQPSDFTPHLDTAILASRTQVAQDLRQSQSTLLLDARPRAFYLGQVKAPAAAQPGTLPGALDFDNARWFPGGSGTLPDKAELERIAQSMPHAAGAQQTVSFCNTGHWAATNWFVLSELLHQPDVKLYPGSMVDWSRAGEPMTNVPSRIQQLWAQLQQTWRAH
ncbi:Rhodanese domain protein [Thiomonas sp. X19]|uniref:sulfurtransferase n=1 Tax=Thiomonas sp. X19 TaxID=1050370 RepID=UPI000B64EACA|nr:rhodanese-like domain-containing protein [Thiomonas sp. X19]SCC92381.1 Rhodanese domain protein [Thiomonas sp. X19]